ncbi:MAG: DUF559 domain-containing protein [Chitinophagales bacterium]
MNIYIYQNDKIREQKLESLGFTILRFSDNEVLNDSNNVLRVLEKFLIEKNVIKE